MMGRSRLSFRQGRADGIVHGTGAARMRIACDPGVFRGIEHPVGVRNPLTLAVKDAYR